MSEKDFFFCSAFHARLDVSIYSHCVCGWVIGYWEGLRNVVTVVHDLLLCLRKWVCNEVDWLHRTYRECQVILSYLIGIKWPHLWLVSHTVGKLTNAWQNSSSISLMLIILLTHTELNCEPVNGCEAFEFDLGCSERGKTNLLWKVCKFLVGEHRSMAHELVDDIGFRCVERLFMVPDILCWVEDFEGKPIQELPLCE